MFKSLGKFLSKSDAYGSSELTEDCTENLVCCVYDGDHKDDARCCSFVTVDESTPDIFQCGNIYDSENMTPQDLAQKKTTNYIRWLLFTTAIIIGIVGGVALLRPDAVVFNTLVDEVSSARLNEGRELQEEARRREQELNDKLANDVNAQILMTFVNKVFASKDTSQDEKRVIKEMMERAANKIDSAHAEKTTIVSPMIIYGALNIYYAVKCIMVLLYTIELKETITHDHILWSVCNVIGYIIATANRGHGMQTSSVTIFLLFYYILSILFWVVIHQRIIYNTYTPRTEHHVQSSSSSSPSSSMSSKVLPLTSL